MRKMRFSRLCDGQNQVITGIALLHDLIFHFPDKIIDADCFGSNEILATWRYELTPKRARGPLLSA